MLALAAAIAYGAGAQLVFPPGRYRLGTAILISGAVGLKIVGGAFATIIYTFKTSGASGNQFSSISGLLTLLDARAGETAGDYGAGFSPAVTTNHIRIRKTAAADEPADGTGNSYIDTINALNPTALVIPRNASAGGESIQYSRGDGSAVGGTDTICIWSMQAALSSMVTLAADNATGATLIVGGIYHAKKANNAECAEVIKTVVAQAGSEVLRWNLVV